jgi:hypothetical protein
MLQTALLGPLTIPVASNRATALEDLAARAAIYVTRVHSKGTRRAY